MNHKLWNLILVVFLMIGLMLGGSPGALLAAGGDGTGPLVDGVFKPLALTSVALEDGSNAIDNQNVPLKPKFTLHFDKNVVYLIYWGRNKACFHLYDEVGKEVPLEVTKIDDTVDFSKRQYIWVEPASPLSPGTNYRLYVAPELIAKNGGSVLGSTTDNKGETINFKTVGNKEAAVVQPNQPSQGSSAGIGSDNPSPQGPISSSNPQGAVQTSPGSQGKDQPGENGDSQNAGTNDEASKPLDQTDGDAVKDGASKSPDPTDSEATYTPSLRSLIAQYVAYGSLVVVAGWIIFEIIRRKKIHKGA